MGVSHAPPDAAADRLLYVLAATIRDDKPEFRTGVHVMRKSFGFRIFSNVAGRAGQCSPQHRPPMADCYAEAFP
ncbi:hypothetical protein [Paraburkholderia caballeronis]|uniref:hypothetical protein n=1 Tax=Paraburkholderia caballeronis TaxID=416943 RepID=UPI001416FC1B|nr:hypothetical protein [Paraburkholderia caballeronis]